MLFPKVYFNELMDRAPNIQIYHCVPKHDPTINSFFFQQIPETGFTVFQYPTHHIHIAAAQQRFEAVQDRADLFRKVLFQLLFDDSVIGSAEVGFHLVESGFGLF